MMLDRKDCKFDQTTGVLTVRKPNGPFPEELEFPGLEGTLIFVQDHELAIRNEFWDGMAMAYQPTIHVPKLRVVMMVVDELF